MKGGEKMNKKIKLGFAALILAVILVAPVMAQEEVGPATFKYSPTLIIAVIVGLVASVVTLYNSRMLAEDLKTSYAFFGIGMLLVVVGFIVVVFPIVPTANLAKLLHDIAFIIGYAFMLFASWKFAKIVSKLKG